ncbi:hypothetical protein BH10ACI1_BH10ACI1_33120 [soil metagenome]
MENILHLHGLPFDALRPVINLDEMPLQLLGEVVAPLPMKKDAPKKVDYEYVRRGTAALFVAVEPLSGQRIIEVSQRRTKADYCRFLQKVAAAYPAATKIVLIQDNLNTHHSGSFYENLPPEQAFALAQRFEFHYTPKKASWLNIAELELSALARLCLSRRIETIEQLRSELEAVVKQRNEQRTKIQWQFSIEQARDKLSRHYDTVKTILT